VDSGGPYSYSDPLRHHYFRSAEAHNVAVFGEKPQKYLSRVVASEVCAGGAYVQGTVELDDLNWTRWFCSLTPGSFLVLDSVRSSQEIDVDYLVRFAPEATVVQNDQGILVSRSREMQVQVISSASSNLSVKKGGPDFPRSYVTRTHMDKVEAPLLRTRVQAKSHWTATLLAFDSSRFRWGSLLYGGRSLRLYVQGPVRSTLVQVNLAREKNGAVILPAALLDLEGSPWR